MPATPAAAVVIALSTFDVKNNSRWLFWAWLSSAILCLLLGLILWSSPYWVLSISDPEIPNLGKELLASKIIIRAAICLSISAVLGFILLVKKRHGALLAMQGPLIFFQLLVLVPVWSLSDQLRQLPLRQAANLLVISKRPYEPLAMVGAAKPSLHFYTNHVIFYEGRSTRGLVNLEERFREEQRQGWPEMSLENTERSRTSLVVIDQRTAKRAHWEGLKPEILGRFGIYIIWRLDRELLEIRAKKIINSGIKPDWREPRPERF